MAQCAVVSDRRAKALDAVGRFGGDCRLKFAQNREKVETGSESR